MEMLPPFSEKILIISRTETVELAQILHLLHVLATCVLLPQLEEQEQLQITVVHKELTVHGGESI
jgi:hypothetical protein